jgi:hypothetical protein
VAATDTPIQLEDGPWSEMIDSIAPTTRKEGAYLLGQNIYPLDPNLGDGVVGRPGVRVLGAQLGSVGRRRVQGHYQYTKQDGSEYTITIVGGYFYTLGWAGEAWTEVLTTAQLAAAAVTLDQTAKVFFLTFKDQVIVSDGVNTPFAWDGTTGGGITKLTNAPIIYGQPTLYEGRWFGIKAAAPTSFVWSEADVLNTGFEAGGYNNVWNFRQTDANRLYRVHGTNQGLLILRGRSASAAGGPVSSAFVAQSTKEGISSTEGTLSPAGLAEFGPNIVVIDADLRPRLLRPGGASFEPIWTGLRETLKKVPRTPALAAKCMAVPYTPAGLMLLAIPEVGGTECTQLLVYDVKGPSPVAVAVWKGWEMTSLALVKSGAAASLGTPYLVHGDSTGYVYLHGNPEDTSPWDDFLATGTVAIAHALECQALGYSTKREKVFDRIDLNVRSNTRQTLKLSTIGPRGKTAQQTITVDSGVLGWDLMLWDVDIWDVDVSTTTQEAHGDVGIDAEARWIKPRIDHATLNEQFGLVALTVLAYGEDDDPEVP